MKIRLNLVLLAMSKVTLISIRNIEKLGQNMVQYKKTGHARDMILESSAIVDQALI